MVFCALKPVCTKCPLGDQHTTQYYLFELYGTWHEANATQVSTRIRCTSHYPCLLNMKREGRKLSISNQTAHFPSKIGSQDNKTYLDQKKNPKEITNLDYTKRNIVLKNDSWQIENDQKCLFHKLSALTQLPIINSFPFQSESAVYKLK